MGLTFTSRAPRCVDSYHVLAPPLHQRRELGEPDLLDFEHAFSLSIHRLLMQAPTFRRNLFMCKECLGIQEVPPRRAAMEASETETWCGIASARHEDLLRSITHIVRLRPWSLPW